MYETGEGSGLWHERNDAGLLHAPRGHRGEGGGPLDQVLALEPLARRQRTADVPALGLPAPAATVYCLTPHLVVRHQFALLQADITDTQSGAGEISAAGCDAARAESGAEQCVARSESGAVTHRAHRLRTPFSVRPGSAAAMRPQSLPIVLTRSNMINSSSTVQGGACLAWLMEWLLARAAAVLDCAVARGCSARSHIRDVCVRERCVPAGDRERLWSWRHGGLDSYEAVIESLASDRVLCKNRAYRVSVRSVRRCQIPNFIPITFLPPWVGTHLST